MISFRRDQLLKELDQVRKVCAMPKLYLANYFADLRDQIDIQIVPKHLKETNQQKKAELSDLWQNMIDKIDQYEKSLLNIKNQTVFISTIQKLESLEEKLEKCEQLKTDQELNEIEQEILYEELIVLKHLFQNKTIALTEFSQKNDLKLILINDEFLDLREFNQGYINKLQDFYFFLFLCFKIEIDFRKQKKTTRKFCPTNTLRK